MKMSDNYEHLEWLLGVVENMSKSSADLIKDISGNETPINEMYIDIGEYRRVELARISSDFKALSSADKLDVFVLLLGHYIGATTVD